MATKKSRIRVIGRREFVAFPLLGIQHMEAKIDTGAYTCSIHCSDIHTREENGRPVLFFTIAGHPSVEHEVGNEISFDEFTTKTIKNSFGEMEERFIIQTLLHIGRKKIRATLSLTNRGSMRYPILIGRRPLKGKFLIDVNLLHTGGIKLSKALKQSKINSRNTPGHENSSIVTQ